MAIATMKELIEAGVHFGSRSAQWNPKMKPFVHSKQNGILIIDLRESLKGLIRACYFLRQLSAQGKKVLFVGTKRQAGEIVRQEANRCGGYFVANRWLGGTLTNMRTMRERVERLEELESLEETGQIEEFSKKMVSSLSRERRKIHRNFEGIRNMKELPGAMVIVDPTNEKIAIAEAMRLDIPLIAVADTDADPDPIDFLVVGNDDSARSLQCLISKLADAILEGGGMAKSQADLQQAARDNDASAAAEEEDAGVDVPEDFSSVQSFSLGGDEDDDN